MHDDADGRDAEYAEYDRELDALAAESEARVVRRPWTPPERPARPEAVSDWQVAALTPTGVGEFLRACRASAGLSQRRAAEAAGVPQSTLARIEAGRVEDVRLSTVARLAAACEVTLVGARGSGAAPLETDLGQRHRDGGARWLPAHLPNRPRDPYEPAEWMFPRYDRQIPRRRYRHHPHHPAGGGRDEGLEA